MSLNMDMKMIGSSNSELVWQTAILSWISLRISNVVWPGKIFHSNSIGSPSIPNSCLYRWSFHCSLASGCPCILLQTKNWVWVDVYLCFRPLNHFVMHSFVETFRISWFWFKINFLERIKVSVPSCRQSNSHWNVLQDVSRLSPLLT